MRPRHKAAENVELELRYLNAWSCFNEAAA